MGASKKLDGGEGHLPLAEGLQLQRWISVRWRAALNGADDDGRSDV